ncbi:MAG: PLP-dependent aminotransferase family protein [Lachnospiraceae bacterium]
MLELTFPLDAKSKIPLYEQIYSYIKDEIKNGNLAAAVKLPSTRALAEYLQVSRSTVELAYEQLISEGYLETVPWKGYYVSELQGLYHIETEVMQKNGEKTEDAPKYRYDFSANGIELDSFPYNTWRKITKKVQAEHERGIFQTGHPKGERIFRENIASYVHQARGVKCTADQIIIGAGSDYLLLLLHFLLGSGHVIAMENPGYLHACKIFRGLFREVVTVGSDKYGMSLEELRDTGADIAYVMPSHQYPLGTVMPIKRRMELLSWAMEKEGRYIIEDDYDSEFRYKGKPIPALQGNDPHGKVIYLGTFSKAIAPSIRISYLILPKELLALYEAKGRCLSTTVSRFDQMIVNEFIIGGYMERHLNKMRGIYKARHDTLMNALKVFGKSCRIKGENAGVHLLLEFQGSFDAGLLTERAKEQGIKTQTLSAAYLEPVEFEDRSTVILGYAVLKEEDIEAAVAALYRVWQDVSKEEY